MMTTYSSGDRVRREASMAAARALVQLKIDTSQPIDIFKIIQDQDIWLMFQPLKSLFGVYLRQNETAGIILNAKHPLSLQRFTAAHEFGHHMLHHTMSLDTDVYIERAQNNTNLDEVAADAFAAHFLMPLRLVNTMLLRLGLSREPEHLTPLHVYMLALDMGVSYTAAVNQLATLGKITQNVAAELRQQRPKDIKKQIGSRFLDNPRIDVWALDLESSGKQINPRIGDEISISLPEAPSTGYLWMIDPAIVADLTERPPVYAGSSENTSNQPSLFGLDDGNSTATLPLTLISSEYEANEGADGTTTFGGGGTRYLTFRTVLPGRHALHLVNRRPWQKTALSDEVFKVSVNVLPKPTGDSESGLSVRQQSFMADV